MNTKGFDIEGLTGHMSPDHSGACQRREFLELGELDCALLRAVHGPLQAHQADVAAAFYGHLLAVPTLRGLLADPVLFARLQRLQGEYFNSLTAGDYGDAYVRNRVRVGIMHHHVGIEPQWYIGAYRKYLSVLAQVLREVLATTPEQYAPTYDALLKVVCFDMCLALDTYFASGRMELLGLKNYSEQVISSMPTGVMVIDADGRVRTVNAAIGAMQGLPPDCAVAGQPYERCVADAALRGRIELAMAQSDYRGELVAELDVAATRRYLRCSVARTWLDGEKLLLLIMEDITAPMQAKAALHDSEERFRIAFSQAAVGLAQLEPEGSWLRANQKFQDIVGYTEEELRGMTFRDITPGREWLDDEIAQRRLLAGEVASYTREKRYLRKDGQLIWVNVSVARMQASSGELSLIVVIEDIARRKQSEHELRHLASHDPLTGLANRSLMLDRLRQALAAAQRGGRQVSVLFIDLDRFKHINDSLGHDAGDQVIIEVGRRLAAFVREGDTVARLGGDEFVVLLTEIEQADALAALACKLLATLTKPMTILGHEVSPIGSIGISIYPKDSADGPALLKNADAAMYRAKQLGRGNFQFFAEELNARTLDRLQLEGGLWHALERDEFTLVYQPQFDMRSGAIVGVEALLRWQPTGAPPVPPDSFLSIAEQTGLIVQTGAWVLRMACAQQVAWRNAGLPCGRVAVNLSARQFRQPDLAQMVVRTLKETGCAPDGLALEISETAIMADPQAAAATLQQLGGMGVHLVIDDFGAGYSSLSHLNRLPVHVLKIDRSFIRDMCSDGHAAGVARAAIALGHSMNLAVAVAAAGVETTEQQALLREQGCDQMQGFLLSRPLPADPLAAMMLAQQ